MRRGKTRTLAATMLALEVEVDGKKFVIAGVEDWGLLSAHLTASRARPDAPAPSARVDSIELSIGGLTERDTDGGAHHFRWGRKNLNIGSRVVIRVVEVESADPPIKRYRSDAKVQENPFTDAEIREMRWQEYLELKQEFEPDAKK